MLKILKNPYYELIPLLMCYSCGFQGLGDFVFLGFGDVRILMVQDLGISGFQLPTFQDRISGFQD